MNSITDGGARAELLADFKQGGRRLAQWLFPLPAGESDAEAQPTLGYHPAFIRLAAGLTGDPGKEDGAAFITQILDRVTPEKGEVDVVRRWFARSWTSQLSGRIDNPSALEAARSILALVEASTDRLVTAKEWRSVRGALARAVKEEDRQGSYLDVVLAMAFDLEQTPEAAADVIAAWSSAISRATFRACGWTEDLAREFQALSEDVMTRASEGLKTEDRETAIRIYQDRMANFKAASPRLQELDARHRECWTVINVERQRWLVQAREDLLALVL